MPYKDPIVRKLAWNRGKARRREKNKAWYKELKKSLKCASCGYSHPAALQFHHLIDKRSDVSKLAASGNVSPSTILAEIAKCEVLCANCHAVRHYEEGYSNNVLSTQGFAGAHPEFQFPPSTAENSPRVQEVGFGFYGGRPFSISLS